MPWDRTRTGAVSSSRGPARWRARGAGAAAVGEAGEAGAGSARRGGAQTAGSGAAGEGSGAVTPGAYGRGGAGGRTHPSPGRRWDAEDAGLDRTLVPGPNPAFQRLGAADPRVRTARPQRGARRTARGRGPGAIGRSEKVALAYHWGSVVVSFARDVASFRRSVAGRGGGGA